MHIMLRSLLLCCVLCCSLVLSARKVQQAEGADVQPTVQGCTCKDACDSKLSSAFSCDVCRTKERGCGRFALFGRWDYCDFSKSEMWESKEWRYKIDYYWSKIKADPTRIPDNEVSLPTAAVTTSPKTSFDNFMREMPEGRKKIIHAIGSVCKIELDISEDSPYTGLLGPGTHHGFIRLGNAVPYWMGMSPGLGFKFPRTGIHSGDFVALDSLDFDHSGNFFQYNQSNHIPSAEGLVQKGLVVLFERATQCASQVGLSDLTRYSQDGAEHANLNFPFKLVMTPSDDAQLSTTEKNADEMHAAINSLPAGTTLYSVYGCETPVGDESNPLQTCGGAVKLGDIKISEKCTSSKYGDRHLQIRHQRIEEDWKLKPQYLESDGFSSRAACGKSSHQQLKIDGAPSNCNTADMLASDA